MKKIKRPRVIWEINPKTRFKPDKVYDRNRAKRETKEEADGII